MIATKKLYKLVSLKEYRAAQQDFLKGLGEKYNSQTTLEKWEFIIQKLNEKFPDKAGVFNKISQKRANISASAYNISLESCVDYFENYLFLFSTEDKSFQLNEFSKKQLLIAIENAFSCETGVNTRLEEVLQKYRADKDWISDTLYKSRYDLILYIADGYNKEYGVSAAMEPHTLHPMRKLAVEQYGISVEHDIKDAFASDLTVQFVSDFFNQKAPQVFTAQYEEEVHNILTAELAFQILTLFKPKEFNWNTDAFDIELDSVQELVKFVESRGLPNSVYQEIGEITEVEDPLTRTNKEVYRFKPRVEVIELLKRHLKDKLIKEEYFISFDQLKVQNVANLNEITKLHGKVALPRLVEILDRLSTSSKQNEIKELLIECHEAFLHYPDLFLTTIEKNPGLLQHLPKAYKTNHFLMDKLTSFINLKMTEWVRDKKYNAENVQILIDTLLSLLEKQPYYLENIPNEIFQNPKTHHLIQKNGWLFEKLPVEFNTNQELLLSALKDAPLLYLQIAESQRKPEIEARTIKHKIFADIGVQSNSLEAAVQLAFAGYATRLKDFDQTQIKDLFDDNFSRNSNLQEANTKLKKLNAIYHLTHSLDISYYMMSKLAHQIDPFLLESIQKYRITQGLPPLPYASKIADFISAITKSGMDWSKTNASSGYLTLKKIHIKNERFNLNENTNQKDILALVTGNENWFEAMAKYSQQNLGFKYWGDIWDECLKLIKKLFKFILNAAILTLSILYLTSTLLDITALVYLNLFIIPLLGVGILLPYLAAPLRLEFLNRITGFISTVCWAPLSVTGIIFAYDLLLSIALISKTGKFIADMAGFATHFFKRTLAIFSHDPLYFADASVKSQCENSIARLELLNEPSASKKAAILRSIFDQISFEIDKETGHLDIDAASLEKEWSKRLAKSYHFSYEGKQYQGSFNQIASLKRHNSIHFELVQSRPYFNFFNTRSTTMLAAVEKRYDQELQEVATLGLAASS